MHEGLVVAGKYRLLKLIGSGGMGAVWLARNEMTEREFAIKFLHPSAAQNPKVLQRFFQEAKVSGRLRSPSILEIYDVGTAHELENAPFLVMELLDGAPLDMAIRLLGTLPLRMTLQLVSALGRALALAHEKGVVHRDLKPANVFLHRSPSGGLLPKLLDFGISKLSRTELSQSDSSSMGLTQTGAVLGSPLYMSPEQAAGDKHVDGRSDIHALGVLTWWCLVGRSPFKSTTYNNLVVEIITGDRPKLLDAAPDVPPGVSDIVSRAYARKREDRFANAMEMAVAIERELAALGPGPTLDSREWAEELFNKLRITAGHPSSVSIPIESGISTTGAVSVSVDDNIPPSHMRSPAAYTVDPSSAALAPTQALPSAPMLAARASSGTITASTPGNVKTNVTRTIIIAAAGFVAMAAMGLGVIAVTRGGTKTDPGNAATTHSAPSTPTQAQEAHADKTAPVETGAGIGAAHAHDDAGAHPAATTPPAQTSVAVTPPAPTPKRGQPPVPKQPPRTPPPNTAPATTAHDPSRGITNPGLF
jgi:serine/threonine protein kinase